MATNNEHTSKRFDAELDAVKNSILQMGQLVQQQFQFAISSLNSGDTALIKQVRDMGYEVDQLEIDVDHQCNLILARRQPEANDLRLMLTALKITTDLERIGDLAELIVRRTEMLLQRGGILLPRFADLNHCSSLVLNMLGQSLDAFSRSDATVAGEIILQDQQVNEEYDFITRNLIGRMLEDPRAISSALDFLFISKSIERIGDHAKSVAEHVIFMAKGLDVRHSSIEEMERKVRQASAEAPPLQAD